METKRCAYCHKLQRADTQVCSRCGHVFVHKKLRPAKREWTQPSIPPASPHGAGHYAGLHPEDQPYQSSKIAIRRMTTEDIEEWRSALPEPEHIILPMADPVSDPAIPLQSELLAQLGRSSVEELPVVAEPPSYAPRKRLLPRRAIPVLLALSGIFFLLASSIFAFVWINRSVSNGSTRSHVVVTATTMPHTAGIAPVLQLSTSSLSFGADGPGIITNKVIEILNTGGKQIVGHSDQSWLSASPITNTSPNRARVLVIVNRGTLVPDQYMGHILFASESVSSGAPLKLTVTMVVVNTVAGALAFTPPALSFASVMGQQQPIYKAIILQNKGDLPLNWSASASTTDQGDWLSADLMTGTLEPGVEKFIDAKVNPQGLQRGSYQGTITLSAGDETKQVAISLIVS